MTSVPEAKQTSAVLSQRLLLSVAEELKMPLIQIANLAEASQLQENRASSSVIQTTASSALKLIDNYILGVRLSFDPQSFMIENVSVSSILYDTAHELSSLAKNYDVDLELSIAGKFGPVSANQAGLQAALVSLGAALIEALPAIADNKQLKLRLATHRSRYGIVAGVYTDVKQISLETLNAGRRLQGNSRQPFVSLTHSSGAGIFVADAILHAMDLKLTASRHHHLYGIGTVLKPSSQLQFI